MTKPDLTSAAPKRIYLDIGDQFALERVTSGSLRWDLLDGVTWSEDNATSHGIPYVRADLVPTPAASGAAPADWRPALNEARELAIKHGAVENDGMQMSVELYMTLTTLAKVIAEARARTALASPQVAPEGVPAAWVHRDSRSAVPFVEDAAKVISWLPPEALWPEGVPSYIQVTPLYATPVQVAPPASGNRKATPAMIQAGAAVIDRETRGQFKEISDGTTTDTARMVWREMNAAAPVAPQDDARDAASNDLPKKLMAIARRDGLTWEDRVAIGRAIAALSPAAKPTEEPGA